MADGRGEARCWCAAPASTEYSLFKPTDARASSLTGVLSKIITKFTKR